MVQLPPDPLARIQISRDIRVVKFSGRDIRFYFDLYARLHCRFCLLKESCGGFTADIFLATVLTNLGGNRFINERTFPRSSVTVTNPPWVSPLLQMWHLIICGGGTLNPNALDQDTVGHQVFLQ